MEKARYQRRFDRRENGREIFGPAAGHHGIDGRLLHRAGREVGRNIPDNFVRRPRRARQHPRDAQVGRRHDRQPVRPAAVEEAVSIGSSWSSTTILRAESGMSPNRTASLSGIPNSTDRDPHPGWLSGRLSPRSARPVSARHSALFHPIARSASLPPLKRISVGTVSMSSR